MAKIYLAPDDEITSVIEKLRADKDQHIVLVAPKGAALLQSVINLRMLKKKADSLGKIFGLVCDDNISKNLAAQVGITVYDSLQDVPKIMPAAPAPIEAPVMAQSEPEVIRAPSGDEKPGDATPPVQAEKRQQIGHVMVKGYERAALPTQPDIETNPTPEVAEPALPAEESVQELPNVVMDDTGAEAVRTSEADEVIVGEAHQHQEEPSQSKHEHKVHFKPARRPRRIPRSVKVGLMIATVLLLCAGVAAAVYIPTAVIHIHVPAEALQKKVTLTIDPALAVSTDTLLAGIHHTVDGTGSGQTTTTGKKEVGDKAKGIIGVSNSWSSDAQTLAKNTVFVGDKGLLFRSLADASVPGATSSISNGQIIVNPGKQDIAVVADQPGDQYNLGASKFTIQGLSGDKANKITGASTKAFTGGTTKELNVVAQADIDKITTDAKLQLEQTLNTGAKAAVPAEETLIDQAIQVTDAGSADHQVGDQADTVALTSKGTLQVISIKQDDALVMLTKIFTDGLASGKTAVIPHPRDIVWEVTHDGANFKISKEINAQVVTRVNEDRIKSRVRAKKLPDVETIIVQEFGASSAAVTVTPARWPIMPMMTSRIHLDIGD